MNESSRSGPAEGRSRLSRRTLFAGAGTAGAVAAVASVMPVVQAPESAAIEPKPAPERGGGSTLSEHVKHYYRTTRL